MPSPFPGMDPYLEDPEIWPDLQHSFAVGISKSLNAALPASYYALLGVRKEIGQPVSPTDARRDEPIRHLFVEVRDTRQHHKLITLIEILSPSNKREGPDRDAYAAKQRDVLGGDARLVEIDLLRAGTRVLPSPVLVASLAQIDPPPTSIVLVSTAWKRADPRLGYHAFPFGLRDRLPCIGVPLGREEPEVPLDLQFVFNRAYDGGPYRRGAVDYSRPPIPPLSGPDAEWAEASLREQGLASA